MISEEVLKSKSQIVPYQLTDINQIMMVRHGEKWLEYREKWAKAGAKYEVEDIPLYVVMELNSFCNLRCKMCKHAEDTKDTERKSMSMDIFEKVINECGELQVPSINIGSGTECTLHPQFKKIALETKNSGAIDKFFLTNGSTLTDEVIGLIFDGEYERVEISVDAATEETYKKIRKGGNFLKLEKGIQRLIDEKRKRGGDIPIIRLSFCVQEDNKKEIDEFYEKWNRKVDIIEFQKLVSLIDSAKEAVHRECNDPFNRLIIDYDGNIYPCCSIFYQNEYCLGNIKDISLYEAWHGQKMEALRSSFRKGKLFPHCNNCLVSIEK